MFLYSSTPFCPPVDVPKTFDPVRKGDRIFYQERTKDLNEGLLYSDFSTQSLLDAEAIDLLRPLSPMSASRLSALDSAESSISNLSNFVESIPTEPSNND